MLLCEILSRLRDKIARWGSWIRPRGSFGVPLEWQCNVDEDKADQHVTRANSAAYPISTLVSPLIQIPRHSSKPIATNPPPFIQTCSLIQIRHHSFKLISTHPNLLQFTCCHSFKSTAIQPNPPRFIQFYRDSSKSTAIHPNPPPFIQIPHHSSKSTAIHPNPPPFIQIRRH